MAKNKLGGLKPRYSFILNPYIDVRCSRCPKCDRLTHPRKFALFVHIDGWGPLVLGKTCRYCTPCEMIIAHKDELDAELARAMANVAPAAVGNKYLVLGTMEKKLWQKGLSGSYPPLEESLKHVAQFKKVLDLKVTGGWGPA
jgi:hypothetical protein